MYSGSPALEHSIRAPQRSSAGEGTLALRVRCRGPFRTTMSSVAPRWIWVVGVVAALGAPRSAWAQEPPKRKTGRCSCASVVA